jgi:hypothetical protein
MSTNITKTQIDESILKAMLDRLIPAVDDLPSAGQMELVDEIVRLSGQQSRFQGIFESAMKTFANTTPDFTSKSGSEQDDSIRKFESEQPESFDSILTISYIVYYKDDRVHKRLGWSGNTPQPNGNEMEPWDESVLDNMRTRKPFWRKVD